MEKRQSIMAAVAGLFILAAAGFWWFTQNAEEAPAAPAVTAAAPAAMHATVSEPLSSASAPPAPVVVAPAPAAGSESDAVALSEEAVDKVLAEKNELASRASDLDTQVSDGKALIALKEKQIRELEAQLQKTAAGKTAATRP